MKTIILLIQILANLFLVAQTTESSGTNCFYLLEKNGQLSIDKIYLENNTVQVINDKDVVSVILSWGEGMSGDVIFKEKRNGMFIVQNKDGLLRVKYRDESGNEKSLPEVKIEMLKRYNIRINITSENGMKKAFLIKNYEVVNDDDGPVIDMFGGKIPLNEGDYSITTESKLSDETKITLKGNVDYQLIDGWIIVPFYLEKDNKLNFILDLAATSSVVAQKILPEKTTITKTEMIANDGLSSDTLSAKMQGATGKLDNDIFLGKAVVPKIYLGNVELNNVKVSVLKNFPKKLEELEISGILGLDILQRAEAIKINGLKESSGGKIFFVDSDTPDKPDYNLSLTKAGGLFFTSGSVDSYPVEFIVDFGARETILSKTLFEKIPHNSFKILEEKRPITGIDGKSSISKVVSVPHFKLSDYSFKDQSMIIADIDALNSFGIQNTSALLGMNFFTRFNTIVIDFKNKHLKIWQ